MIVKLKLYNNLFLLYNPHYHRTQYEEMHKLFLSRNIMFQPFLS